MPQIETERTILRMFGPADLDDLASIYADEDVMRYLSGHPLSREETSGWLEYFLKGWEQYGFGWWAVTSKDAGEIIGHCGLQFIHITPEVEVTYGLAKKYWRQGIGSEIGGACLRYGFEELNLERIYALADPGNTASHRVMQRIGMTYYKTEYYKDDLYEGDLIYYVISRSDYRPDGSSYTVRKIASDDERITVAEAFEQRRIEFDAIKVEPVS